MKNKFLYLMIGAILLIIATVWLYLGNKKQAKTDSGSIVPTARPTEVSVGRPSPSLSPYPGIPASALVSLIPGLPYENNQFLVEYLPKAKMLYITVFDANSGDTNYRAALKWLEAQGIPYPGNNRDIRFVYFR